MLNRFFERIAAKSQSHQEHAVLVVAFGDSVTAGAGWDSEYYRAEVYHARFREALEQEFSHCIFNMLNAGEVGQSVSGSFSRLERDVLQHQPDLTLIAFGLNDAVQLGTAGLDAFKADLQEMVRHIKAATPSDIVLVTPNMMLTQDNSQIPDKWKHVTQQFIEVQNGGVLESYAAAIRDVADREQIVVADVYGAWKQLSEQGVDTTAMLSNGLNHPDHEGHRLSAEVLSKAVHQHKPQ